MTSIESSAPGARLRAAFSGPRGRGFVTGLGLALIHLCALAAFVPGLSSWSAVIVAAVLIYVTGGLGVTIGYHRLLTHRSMRLSKGFEYALTILGVLALQGGPIDWVATHRRHHATSDRPGDPHGMDRGFWWAHVGWLFLPNPGRPTTEEQHRLAADLVADPFYRFMEKTSLLWQVGLGILLFALGGWSWVVWGIFVRLVITYHITWLVNSASHWTGYRTFRTDDRSSNNWWVALLAWGEGWHNNHHAFPSSARHGMRWFELDLTWFTIRLFQLVGIVRSVKLPTQTMLDRLRVADGAKTQSAKTILCSETI